jgi:hypothetical protein
VEEDSFVPKVMHHDDKDGSNGRDQYLYGNVANKCPKYGDTSGFGGVFIYEGKERKVTREKHRLNKGGVTRGEETRRKFQEMLDTLSQTINGGHELLLLGCIPIPLYKEGRCKGMGHSKLTIAPALAAPFHSLPHERAQDPGSPLT